MKNSRKSRLLRQLLAVTLLINGSFHLAAPVLAQTTQAPAQKSTSAGTNIDNTATGTYEDSNNPGTQINTTSNTVTITVAEVAGITVTGTGVDDVNGGNLQPNDVVNYDFTVTNTGNDPTKIFIPGVATVTNGTAGTLLADLNNDGTFETTVPAEGLTTTNAIPAGGQIKVRVPVTVNAGTAGQIVSVVLGNTGPNDNSAATQNQPDATDSSNPNEVRTVDGDPGTPANGEREASARQESTVGTQPGLQNGPEGQPGAIGPTDNNDDFTGQSASVPTGLSPAARYNPARVRFTSTLKNQSATPLTASLLPTPPANPADLPNGTLVTLSYGGKSATYEYNNGVFTFVSGTGGASATEPIEITLAPGETADYTVDVDLPDGTEQLTGFPVPITAFIDTNNNGVIDPQETQTTTIEKVYTGYLELLKETRILKGTGPDVPTGQGDFSDDPKTPAPGNIIEYRITYENISDPGGANSRVLNAAKVVITEDGTTEDNNWAKDNDGDGVIDTSNVAGTAADTNGGDITFTRGNQTGTTADADVTKYVNEVPVEIAPGGRGEFTFQRKVN